MAAASRVTVATTAGGTLLAEAPSDQPCEAVIEVPSGGATVYVGGSGVTTATGFPVEAQRPLGFPLTVGEKLYGIVAASTQEVAVLKNNTA